MTAGGSNSSTSFFSEFPRVFRWRPKQAIQALYWHLTRRRVRARNLLRRDAHKAPYAYDFWIKTVEQADIALDAAPTSMTRWSYRPLISIVLPLGNEPDISAAISSVHRQCYPHWEMILPWPTGQNLPAAFDREDVRVMRLDQCDTAEAINQAAASARGKFMLTLQPGVTLPATALFHYVEALQVDPQVGVIFGDHDSIDACGKRVTPWLKPGWNSEMILCQDYVSQACIVRVADARAITPIESDLAEAAAYFQMLRIASLPTATIEHVAHIVAHLGPEPAPNQRARAVAVARHLAASGAQAVPAAHDLVRVDWPLPAVPPHISIIIPTRDRANLLRTCIGSVRSRTDWSNYDIVVIDNDSIEHDTLSYFHDLQAFPDVSIFSYSKPFNFSDMNNLAAAWSRGNYLCFLNNDTEVISPDWLTRMMRQAVRPEVGAVGARLCYEDGSVQHAGVVIGMGGAAGHAHRFQEAGNRGYFHQVDVTRFVSAVTAACMVVKKEKFEIAGGFDNEHLKVAYNDVDLCMKLQNLGWRNVYESTASLFHYESKSRGSDFSPQHLDRYMKELSVLQTRWGTDKFIDPTHHPKLDRSQETYVLKF